MKESFLQVPHSGTCAPIFKELYIGLRLADIRDRGIMTASFAPSSWVPSRFGGYCVSMFTDDFQKSKNIFLKTLDKYDKVWYNSKVQEELSVLTASN